MIALSQSGINGSGQGEDADVAGKVPGVDVIVSGQTHDKVEAPARVGPQTLIMPPMVIPPGVQQRPLV